MAVWVMVCREEIMMSWTFGLETAEEWASWGLVSVGLVMGLGGLEAGEDDEEASLSAISLAGENFGPLSRESSRRAVFEG